MRPARARPLVFAIGCALALGLLGLALSALWQAEAEAQQAAADEVTVVVTEMAPFVVDDDGRPRGFYFEIWDEVARALDVEYSVVWVDSFDDLLPAVADGRADVAIAPFTPTAAREAEFDFSSAVVSSGPQLGFSEGLLSAPTLLRSLFDTRVLTLFAVAVVGLLVMAHVIWFFERNRHDQDGDFDRSYVRGIWDGLWWSTVTATTVGYGDKAPKSVGGRLIALLAMLSSVVLVAAFVSQVTSIMTDAPSGDSAEALEDVDGDIGVVAGTSFAAFLADEGVKTVEFGSQAELFDALENGEIDAVVSNPFALAALDARIGIRTATGVLYEEFETFGMAQGSPWREPINQALADLQASGEIAEIVKDGLN